MRTRYTVCLGGIVGALLVGFVLAPVVLPVSDANAGPAGGPARSDGLPTHDELQSAGAYRVYEDPADLLRHLDEVGVRPAE